jgi:cerevisin
MASPHIAGLLAYLLSLQPSKDSAFAVADISPKKLKADLLSIATKNALTDVPSNTANILAWNGGGVSNYTSIVEKGSYTASHRPTMLEEIESEAKVAGNKLSSEGDELAKKVAELTDKVEDLISGELKEMFRELKRE